MSYVDGRRCVQAQPGLAFEPKAISPHLHYERVAVMKQAVEIAAAMTSSPATVPHWVVTLRL